MPGYDYIIWDWNGTILDDLQVNFEVENTLHVVLSRMNEFCLLWKTHLTLLST